MPSTYSNLKIQLMSTGENTTTWGNVTNVNLGTAIEEAIAGSADVTFASGNVTLTLTDTNATQTARNMRLRCTGTTGGSTRNLVVPSIEKPYIIQNDCADSILVKTAAGTGVTVPAGKTLWVFSDGTNVVDVTTHLTTLTLGTALPVASGGTGSNTAAGARTSLGATTVGGNFFTLANPSAVTFPQINANNTVSALDAATFRAAIGAGSSNASGTVTLVSGTGTVNGITLTGSVTTTGSLTLGGTLSGVSLTTQVSGTLPIANGGTNATTAAGARTSLGATTLGGNLFTLTNVAAISFLRVNADNTVSTLDAATFRSAIGAGTVTSVDASGGTTGLTFSGGPVTSTGTLTLAGTLAVANGGTGATTASAARTNLGAAASGAATASGLTISTSRLLGRTTAGTGALEEITVGSGLSLSAGTLTSTGSGGTVTSVGGTGSVNGITLTGTVTTSGNLTLGGTLSGVDLATQTSGTLSVSRGGTGATTLTGLVVGNGTSAFTTVTAPSGAVVGTTDSQTLSNKTIDANSSISDTGTIAATSPGFRGIPQNSQTGAYTLALTDAGKHISNTTGGFVIPANGSVAFPVGTTVVLFNNSSSTQTVSITTDTLRQAGTTNTGSRTLAAYGVATCIKVASTTWVISGNVS